MDKTFRSNSVGLGVKMKRPGASGSASEVGLATGLDVGLYYFYEFHLDSFLG